jgi:DNA primase
MVGRIADEDVARVREATDLLDLVQERVVLKQRGRLFWGCCPFHQEKTPSFKVDPATGLWHCFGCGIGGDVYGWVMRTEGVDFGEAVRMLADRAHIEIHETSGGAPRSERERLIAANEAAVAYYHDVLTKSPDALAAKARDYLTGRGFGSAVAKKWRLGFASGRGRLTRQLREGGFTAEELVSANLALKGDAGRLRDRFFDRVMFPIFDINGRPIAFGGRVIGAGEPKYLNSQDTPVFHKSANLYGIDKAKALITSSGTAIVVEGYTDVIALHEAGVANAVATLGTALTREHVRLLGRFARRVVYLFDGDAAGLRAADRAAEFIDRTITPEAGQGRIELFVAVIPNGNDPAECVEAEGAEALAALVEAAVPLLRFSIDRRLERWDLDRPEERSRALKEAAEVLAPVKDSLLADDYATYIADKLFADVSTVKRAIASAKVAPRAEPRAQVADGAAATGVEAGRLGVDAALRVESPQTRLERDLLDLLVRTPRLRQRARFLLSEDLLSDPVHNAIAEVIASAGVGISAEALVGRLAELVPGSAEALSGATLGDVSGEDVEAAERDMTRKLKEFDLERRIAQGKARLKQRGSFKDQGEFDDVFKSVSELQRELGEYRQGRRDVG